MRILAAEMVNVSHTDLTLWLLGGALVGILVGRWMTGGLRALAALLGDLFAGALGALTAIALVSYFVNLASYSVGGRLAVALVGAAIFVAVVRGVQYKRARRPPTPAAVTPPDQTSATPPPNDAYHADDTPHAPPATA
jgi:uncharacterized membrane protein YeaQ/YmgE (transglycosylase-associated protein family)